MNPYILSFTSKFDHFFDQKEISNMIYLHDEEDNERLDHVFFLEQVDGGVVGIYVRGMNPLISGHRIYDLDDFNLFASYERLVECMENIKFKIEYMSLFFSTQYNELLGAYLANNEETCSLLMLFLQDEIYIERDFRKSQVSEMLGNHNSYFKAGHRRFKSNRKVNANSIIQI